MLTAFDEPHKPEERPIRLRRMRLAFEISFEEFKKLDIRVGCVTSVEKVRRTEKLYKILVDLGSFGTRQTISSLVGYYEPNELGGKRVVFLTNLKQAKFAGEVSQGMLLAAEADGKLALLTTDRDIQPGARIT
jgi:methionyl-tRNA synthetase